MSNNRCACVIDVEEKRCRVVLQDLVERDMRGFRPNTFKEGLMKGLYACLNASCIIVCRIMPQDLVELLG